jgi:alginate O-acetyltransferase complex protein AlgJ
MVTSSAPPETREAIARRDLGHTDVGGGTVRFLIVFFVALIAAAPAYELAGGRADDGTPSAWSHLSGMRDRIRARIAAVAPGAGVWTTTIAANRGALDSLRRFEEALEDDSRVGRLLRPRAQLVLSRWFGAGNERAYTGREGWLYYRPDVEYLTGRGFLEPDALERRVAIADEWTTPPQPDPRRAIVGFKRELDARGIALIVVPAPVKPSIHPEYLTTRYSEGALPLQNPSYRAFVEELEREGVAVFDPAPMLAGAARATGASQYLATDTHWRPEAMEAVAESLAGFVRQRVDLPADATKYRIEPREVHHLGDIASMLDLPRGQTLYPGETVTIRRVLQADGSAWRSSRTADVLVLGDSFSNIFSLASMGWGDSAGLVEQLSYALQRPVDRIVQNDLAAHATRDLLRRAGAERLTGKRVVVYQFAARELPFGDWRVFE